MAKKIEVELSVRDKGTPKVKSFSDKATRSLKMLAGPLVAGAVTAAFVKMGKHILTLGDQLDKMSQRTGFSVEQLDKLRQAAILGGTSIETVERAIRKLQKNIVDANRGMGLAKNAFEEMGISIVKLSKLKPEDQFRSIAAEILKIDDPTKQAAAAMDILGISGTQLIPMLKAIASGLKDFNAQMTTEQAKNIARFNDNIAKMKISFEGLAARFIGPVVEKLNALFDITSEFNRLETEIELDKVTTQLRLHKETLEKLGPITGNWMDVNESARAEATRMIPVLEEEKKVLEEQLKVKKELAAEESKAADITGEATGPKKKESMKRLSTENNEVFAAFRAEQEANQKKLEEMAADEKEWQERMAEMKRNFRQLERDAEREELEKKKALSEEEAELLHEARERERQENFAAIEERKAQMEEMAIAAKNTIVDPLIEAAAGAKTFKEAFSEMAISVLKQLAQIIVMLAIKKALESYGGGAGAGTGAIGGGIKLADGGVLRGGFKAFATGGVADRPTLGLIGEAGPEAIVPLPDGRSIPVDMQGGGEGKTTNNNFYVQALDAQSLVELMRRNPEAIIAPLTNQIELGNKGLRSNLKKAVA